MDYALHILAFATTLAAILGSAFDKMAIRRKIWFSAAIFALLVLVVSIYKTQRDHQIEDEQIRKLSYLEERIRETPRCVDERFVDLYGGYWKAPYKIHPGTKIRFKGFDCELELLHEFHFVLIPNTLQIPYEYTIMNMAGEYDYGGPYEWQLRALDATRCSGQLEVFSLYEIEHLE